MIFTSGARQRGAELAITKGPTKRCDSANDPEHEQRKSGLNIRELETKTGEDAGANNVGDNDGRCRDKANSPPRRPRLHRTRFSNCSHFRIDNPEISGTREFFRSTV